MSYSCSDRCTSFLKNSCLCGNIALSYISSPNSLFLLSILSPFIINISLLINYFFPFSTNFLFTSYIFLCSINKHIYFWFLITPFHFVIIKRSLHNLINKILNTSLKIHKIIMSDYKQYHIIYNYINCN